jgi:hypothetical protein
MNPYGGEDRIWLGPEGGQYSLYFAKGTSFDFANWFVPAAFDTQPFQIVARSPKAATFESRFTLTNYSGTEFHVGIRREVRLLDAPEAWKDLGLSADSRLRVVAYESDNRLTNEGSNAWRPETGLLSIWILGMFAPAPSVTIVAPIRPGPDSSFGRKVTADYFGQVPPDRLKVTERAVFLKADGKYRSKIGLSPRRSRGFLGSYDADNHVLTIVQFDQPAGVTDYVNSLWKLQDHPYGGDVANAYNDGPPSPGAKPMGPFLEMESSSPAAALAPGKSIGHWHRTIHIIGPMPELDRAARGVLGQSLAEIQAAFAP